MKIALFDSKAYDEKYFAAANKPYGFEIKHFEAKMNMDTIEMAKDFDALCLFVNDACDAEVLARADELGIKYVFMRCAGFDRVDLEAASDLEISIARVPAYSPYAVAEFAVGLLMTLNRSIHIAFNRVRDGNFSLSNLDGFDIHGKTVGVIGTGKIGQCFIDIMIGFGCQILANDAYPNKEYGAKPQVTYVELPELLSKSDVISLHVPLLESTTTLICEKTLTQMKPNAILINTSRGGLINTADLLTALKKGTIKGAGLDVYEEETGYFFEDRSSDVILDDTLARLQNMRNVIITSHQAFFTEEALHAIAETTLRNAAEAAKGLKLMEMTNYVGCPVRKRTLVNLKSRNMAAGEARDEVLRKRLPSGKR